MRTRLSLQLPASHARFTNHKCRQNTAQTRQTRQYCYNTALFCWYVAQVSVCLLATNSCKQADYWRLNISPDYSSNITCITTHDRSLSPLHSQIFEEGGTLWANIRPATTIDAKLKRILWWQMVSSVNQRSAMAAEHTSCMIQRHENDIVFDLIVNEQ